MRYIHMTPGYVYEMSRPHSGQWAYNTNTKIYSYLKSQDCLQFTLDKFVPLGAGCVDDGAVMAIKSVKTDRVISLDEIRREINSRTLGCIFSREDFARGPLDKIVMPVKPEPTLIELVNEIEERQNSIEKLQGEIKELKTKLKELL